jgi:hypothetical protein
MAAQQAPGGNLVPQNVEPQPNQQQQSQQQKKEVL